VLLLQLPQPSLVGDWLRSIKPTVKLQCKDENDTLVLNIAFDGCHLLVLHQKGTCVSIHSVCASGYPQVVQVPSRILPQHLCGKAVTTQ
jgi:hypothetical protein